MVLTMFFFFLFSTAPDTGYAATRFENTRVDSLLRTGIDLTLRQHYDGARAVFEALAEHYPDNPAGYLYQAALLQTQAMDYEERVPVRPFDSLLALSRHYSEEMIANEPESPWGHFFLGTTLGNEAFALSDRGDWFGAVTKGMSSISYFEKAVELDSHLVDAFTGIGTYYYWKSRKIEFLTWLPFVKDRRREGIALLQRCAQKGVYNRYAAMSALVNIYIDGADYSLAAEAAQQALSAYSENRIFLWGLATALERGNHPVEAIAAYHRLLQSIEHDSRPNKYNELVCRLNLLTLNIETGNDGNFREELGRIERLAEMKYPAHLHDRLEDKRQKIEALKGSLVQKGGQ